VSDNCLSEPHLDSLHPRGTRSNHYLRRNRPRHTVAALNHHIRTVLPVEMALDERLPRSSLSALNEVGSRWEDPQPVNQDEAVLLLDPLSTPHRSPLTSEISLRHGQPKELPKYQYCSPPNRETGIMAPLEPRLSMKVI
jgi:hypothetical protein